MWLGQQGEPHPLSLQFTGSVGASQHLSAAGQSASSKPCTGFFWGQTRKLGCANALITHSSVMDTGTTKTQGKLQLKMKS